MAHLTNSYGASYGALMAQNGAAKGGCAITPPSALPNGGDCYGAPQPPVAFMAHLMAHLMAQG